MKDEDAMVMPRRLPAASVAIDGGGIEHAIVAAP
jgi:hypothetical protein